MKREDEVWPIEPFNDTVEASELRQEWEEWQRAFELVLESKQINAEHEKYVALLTRGGRGLQRIFFNLPEASDEVQVEFPCAPADYTNAIIRLTKYFKGKVNERVELETFRSIRQTADEGFKQFELKLRIQARRCAFKDREESELLHQIAMGARDEKVRDKGLEDSMSLDQIMNYAINREVLIKQKEKSRPFKAEGEVNAIDRGNRGFQKSFVEKPRFAQQWGPPRQFDRHRQQKQKGSECGACGSFNHPSGSKSCPAQGQRCDNCGRVGHFRRKCRSSRGGQRDEPQAKWKAGKQEVNQMVVEEDDDWKQMTRRPTDDDVSKVN